MFDSKRKMNKKKSSSQGAWKGISLVIFFAFFRLCGFVPNWKWPMLTWDAYETWNVLCEMVFFFVCNVRALRVYSPIFYIYLHLGGKQNKNEVENKYAISNANKDPCIFLNTKCKIGHWGKRNHEWKCHIDIITMFRFPFLFLFALCVRVHKIPDFY